MIFGVHVACFGLDVVASVELVEGRSERTLAPVARAMHIDRLLGVEVLPPTRHMQGPLMQVVATALARSSEVLIRRDIVIGRLLKANHCVATTIHNLLIVMLGLTQ